MFEGINAQELTDILSAVEPVELKGVALLRRRRPRAGQWFPEDVSARSMVEAADELMKYVNVCDDLRQKLWALLPVPSTEPVEEWPL